MKCKFPILLTCLFFIVDSAVLASTIKQGNYRWRADDGSEANASFLAAENTGIKLADSSQNIRLRIEMYNDDFENTDDNTFGLFYSTSTDGPWTQITSDNSLNAFALSLTDNYSDKDSQSSDLLSDTYTDYGGGFLIESSSTFNHTLVANRSDEFEFSIKATSNVVFFQKYYFSIRKSNGNSIDQYGSLPNLIVEESLKLGGGSGTELDPYLISSPEHLDSIRYKMNAHFRLSSDIDMDVDPYNVDEGWNPIGTNTSGEEFSGTFDGNGFTISNLLIDRNSTNFIGLFGAAKNAVIKNIALENVDITGDEYTGGLVGINYSEIRNSYSTGSVSGYNHTGGLVGAIETWDGSIAVVKNSYSHASVSGSNYGASSLVGRLISGTIENSFGTGSVNAPSGNGGLIGEKNSGTVTNSYWDTETTGQATSADGTGLTTAQMKQVSNFSGFDFTEDWNAIDGSDYPYLRTFGYKKVGITGNQGWRMMSSPVSSTSFGTLLDSLWTQGFPGSDSPDYGSANIFTWSESTREWSAPSNASDVPATGSGFITYVYSDDDFDGTPEGFPKTLTNSGSQFTGTASPTLSFTDTETLMNDGWNLLGNPYGTTIDWDSENGWTRTNLDSTFYVWSDSASGGSGAYLSWNGTAGTLENGKIAPWQGFWVKAKASSPSISFNDSVRSTGGIFFKKVQSPQLKLRLTDGEKHSNSVVMFNEKASEGKDGMDAYKLQSLNNDYLLLGTSLNGNVPMDIQALPLKGGTFNLELEISGNHLEGDFTLSWDEKAIPAEWELSIIDREKGTETSIKESEAITFSLQSKSKTVQDSDLQIPSSPIRIAGKAKSALGRFVLKIVQGSGVGNELNSELPASVELQQNYPNPFNPSTNIAFSLTESGKVRLEVFDLMGRRVATLLNGVHQTAGYHSVTFNASGIASGMYLYRLSAGHRVITKKLTLIK